MFLTLFIFFILLSILIFVHEVGHFLVAKRLGIRVEEFGFGLPPRIFGVRRGETIYSINILPIGGFVRLTGEDEVKKTSDKKSFVNKKPIERVLVLISGVLMNFILAILVLSFIFTKGVLVPVERVHVKGISEGSPAQISGLQVNDIIMAVNGEKIATTKQLIDFTALHLGEELKLIILRPSINKEIEVVIIPRKDYPQGEGPMGVKISNLEIRKYAWYQAPVMGIIEALNISAKMVSGLLFMLGNFLTRSEVPKDIAGPIGIYQVTGQAVAFGYLAVLQLLGFLSLNLAVVNILPFPALDGGRLLFVGVEMFFGRRIVPKFERLAHSIGMVVLLTLILLVSLQDLGRILEGSSFLERIKFLIPNF